MTQIKYSSQQRSEIRSGRSQSVTNEGGKKRKKGRKSIEDLTFKIKQKARCQDLTDEEAHERGNNSAKQKLKLTLRNRKLLKIQNDKMKQS